MTDNFLNTRTYSRSRLSFVSCINSETTSSSFWHCCINSSASPYSSLKALLLQFNSFSFLILQALLFRSNSSSVSLPLLYTDARCSFTSYTLSLIQL